MCRIGLTLVYCADREGVKAHPVVPGSSTYRGGGRNLKRGWVSSFRGALSRLSACRWQFYGLLARAGLSRRRSLVAAQCPLAPAAAGRRTASSYHISGYLGQRDEPSTRGSFLFGKRWRFH